MSARRDAAAARRFFRRGIAMLQVRPTEVVTDAAVYPAVLDELLPSAWHHVEQYANNPIEADGPARRITTAFTELAQAI